MKELLMSLNWGQFIDTLWTVILLPILSFIAIQINTWAREKKIDKYTDILQANVLSSVKDVYETIVKDIKHTDDWTPEKQAEVKEIAKQKAIQALSNTAYQCLKAANGDFDDYLDSLVGTALFDIKNK